MTTTLWRGACGVCSMEYDHHEEIGVKPYPNGMFCSACREQDSMAPGVVHFRQVTDMQPWHPMTDPVDLKHTGKTMEECGELISAIARCQIQGINETHPETSKVNKEWLEDEIADVEACIALLKEQFNLNHDRIHKRRQSKVAKLEWWHSRA